MSGRWSWTRKTMAHMLIAKRVDEITHPCFSTVRTMKGSFSSFDEDSWCHLFVE